MSRPDIYYIPDNLNDGRAILNIPNANLAETVVIEYALYNIFKILPLVATVKIAAGIIVMVIVGIITIMGIKDESVCQFIISSIKFRSKRKRMHLRRCDEKDVETSDEERKPNRAEELLRTFEERTADVLEERIRSKAGKE